MVARKNRTAEAPVERPALEGIALNPVSLVRLDDDFQSERSVIDGAIVSESKVSGVALDSCEVRRSVFEESVFSRLRLLDTRLEKCNVSNARWEKAHLRRVEFLHCRLVGISIAEADATDLLVKDCKAQFLRCTGAKLRNTRFEDCELSDADFRATALHGVAFINCDLRNADFGQAKLNAVSLRGSTLDGIKVEAGQLRELTIDPLQALVLVRLLGATVA
jgi:uncharacterized protein YjbI with pentapeptide repeats